MGGDFSRFTERVAKRRLKKRCCLTSLPIEPGDRYTEYAGVYDGGFLAAKMLTIAASIYMVNNDSWSPEPDQGDFWVDSLQFFLVRIGLSQNEAELCAKEARRYALGERVVRQWKFTCFVCLRPLRLRDCSDCLFDARPKEWP